MLRTVPPLLLLLLLAPACETEVTYERLNDGEDCFAVVLSPDAVDDDDSAGDDDDSAAPPPVADMDTIDLRAIPGFFDRDVIGSASITPTRGPARTHFDLGVVLADTRTDTGNPVDVVDRVTVLVNNGDLNLNELDLDPSPADEARWAVELGTGGDPELTRRTDRLCIALYSETE
jgi:hypothetical protein